MQGTITLGSRMRETHVPAYRGRVRSGCLTCRSRKVKCDEARPNCHNCTRLARDCVYKPQRSLRPNTTVQSPSTSPEDAVQDVPIVDPTSNIRSNAIPNQGSPQEVEDCVLAEKSRLHSALKDALGLVQDSIPSPDSSFDNYTSNLETVLRHHQEYNVDSNNSEDDVASTSTLISRDIRLTTTMDKLTAREMGLQPWFSFFVEEVDCSCITPFDALNWRRMKIDVIKIATTNATVASAVLAISALYKGLTYHLPLSKAASFWDISKRAYEDALQREDHDFDAHLPGLFLLCLFSYIDPDSDPILKAPSEAFTARLITWAARPYHPPLSLRLSAWLRLLQAAMIRGGGMGLVSDDLLGYFPSHSGPIPSLKSPTDGGSDVATHLYEVLFDPIFDFYFQLQMISGEIARLTHYHRSRGSGKDQDEVTQQIINIRSKLRDLWSRRSPTQHQSPQDLRSNVSAKIANPIITLVGLCAAAYNAEFVEIDRVLGDPVSESSESKQCMRQIRNIVEGDWNVYHDGKLNPGLLRPLFLYAIECRNCEENQWAADRLGEIKNAVCRSDFFAAFGKALSDTQIRKDRRVTSKFFCIWYFGTVPPFM